MAAKMPPECGARHADQPEAGSDRDAECGIHDQLREKELADAPRGVIQRAGRALQIACACKTDDAVSQFLPLQKDEHDKDQDDAGGRERIDQRREERGKAFQRRRRRRADLDRNGLLLRGRLLRGNYGGSIAAIGAVKFLAEIMQDGGGPLKCAPLGRCCLDGLNLLPDRHLVFGQIAGQLRDLGDNDAADRKDDRKGEEHHDGHRNGARYERFLKQPNERREHEAQQHRERDRDENFASEIETADDQHREQRHRQPALRRWDRPGRENDRRARHFWIQR